MSDKHLLILTYVLLVVLNIFFFVGKYLPGIGFVDSVFLFLKEYSGTMTLLELFGILAIFFDMVMNYEKLGMALRRLRLIGVVVLTFAFFGKIFVNYIDSALLLT